MAEERMATTVQITASKVLERRQKEESWKRSTHLDVELLNLGLSLEEVVLSLALSRRRISELRPGAHVIKLFTTVSYDFS
jgi:hypothetical protein